MRDYGLAPRKYPLQNTHNVHASLTSSPQTTRGTGADVIIIDEAAHIAPALFFKVIVPILSMRNTSLLCLSSPEGDSNYFSELMNLKNGKDDFFHVINCFQICKACRKLERVNQIKCTHVKSTTHWLSKKKIGQLKQLYKASPEDAIREFGGIVVSDNRPALRKEEVEACFKAARVRTDSTPKYVFTTCDPSGGGPSHMSIASGYFNGRGELVVRYSRRAVWVKLAGPATLSTILVGADDQSWVGCTSPGSVS